MEEERMRNEIEQQFTRLAQDRGWEISKRGWPDFLCYLPNGFVAAVAVKARCRGGAYAGKLKLLGKEQARTLEVLQLGGIPCYVSDGITLELFLASVHAAPARRRRTGLMPHAWRRSI